jgi:hypothetical protein
LFLFSCQTHLRLWYEIAPLTSKEFFRLQHSVQRLGFQPVPSDIKIGRKTYGDHWNGCCPSPISLTKYLFLSDPADTDWDSTIPCTIPLLFPISLCKCVQVTRG